MIEVTHTVGRAAGTEPHENKGGDVFEVRTTTASERVQLMVFLEALHVYSERNEKYRDNWRRMGWRGQLIRLRERAERLWDHMWDAPGPDPEDVAPDLPDVDDALDAINFAAFLVRAVREGNRNGTWWS